MTTTLSSFETAIIATGPMYFLRATDDSIMLLPNIINCPLEFLGVDGGAGAMLVPGDGIMGKPSKRFTGDANPGYIRQQLDSSLNTGKITVVAVIGKVRNPPGAPGVPDSITAIVSRQQVGGWTLDCRKNGINFYIYIGGNYRSAFFDHNLLSESGNLVHASFDGRYIKIYLNGILKNTYDAVSSYNISYGDAANLPMLIGAELGSNGFSDATENYGDVDLSHVAKYSFALSQSQIDAHVAAWATQKKLAGTALLDDGSAAQRVVVTEWSGVRRGEVVPASSGAFSATVPPGAYLVTAIGPDGYRPISHGPVTAVDP